VDVVHDSALDRECALALIKTDALEPLEPDRLRRDVPFRLDFLAERPHGLRFVRLAPLSAVPYGTRFPDLRLSLATLYGAIIQTG
jgi:hypothetical protein